MSVYTDLLFMQGHIVNVELARQLAGEDDSNSPARKVADTSKLRPGEQGQAASNETERATRHLADTCSNQ